jgi:hypothetical protein
MATLGQPVTSSENKCCDKIIEEETIKQSGNKSGITMKDILKNKALARLLILASKKITNKNDK